MAGSRKTKADLIVENEQLRQQLAELRTANNDLEMMLEMTTEHSDTLESELYNKVEAAVRDSERRLRLIVEATPFPILITRSENDQIVYANEGAGHLFATAQETLLNHRFSDFSLTTETFASLQKQLTAEQKADNFEMQLKNSNNNPVWVMVSIRPLLYDRETADWLIVVHDITQRKKEEEERAELLRQQVDALRRQIELEEAPLLF